MTTRIAARESPIRFRVRPVSYRGHSRSARGSRRGGFLRLVLRARTAVRSPTCGGTHRAPTLDEIQHLTDQRAPRPVTASDPTWLANFRCHRRSASAYRRGRVLLAGDAVHIHTPAGGQGLNTGMLDAHNLGWKLALVASGRAPAGLLDTYGTERRPVAEEVLELTHVLIRYGTMSHPVKRRVRDIVVPALGRTPVIQRRAARRISQIYVSYPSGPGSRQDGGRGAPRAGSACPTSRSARAARPPRYTASCAVAGTSWSFPRLTCPACWTTPRCGPTATRRRGGGQAAWMRWLAICATCSGPAHVACDKSSHRCASPVTGRAWTAVGDDAGLVGGWVTSGGSVYCSGPDLRRSGWEVLLWGSGPEVVAWLASGHLVIRGSAFGAR